jgi:hypothetical protein
MAIDLTLLTREQLDQFFHMQSIVAAQADEAAKVRALRDYYDGNHPLLLTSRQEEFIGKMLTEGEFEFAHNAVKSIIDTLRERLNVSGFAVNGKAIVEGGDDTGPEAQAAALMWAWWEENRYDAQQIRLHRRALRDGKSYVMVDYDQVNMRPRFSLQPVWDGKTGIVCHRDPEMPDVILCLCKYWYTFDITKPGETGKERRTVYLPGQIRKYIRGGAEYQWLPYTDPEDNGQWPLSWVDRQGNPLGITLFEFENPGGSEVAQIIGLQNLLNKSWLDLVAAADMHGFPILAIEDEAPQSFADAVVVNEQDADIKGDDELFMAPGRILDLHGAKGHRIEAGDLSQLISVVRLTIDAIAGVSKTPPHTLWPVGGNIPSGEALKMLESGLVKRAEERFLIFGQAWADVMAHAYKLERTFGNTSLPDIPKMKVHTLWDDPQTRNEKSDAEMAEIQSRLGVPEEKLWEILGYSPQDIAKFKAMQRLDQAAQTQAVVSAIQSAQARQAAQPNGTVPVTARANGNGANGNGVVG